MGANPNTINKIIPGIKKLLKGEFSNIDKGIPNSLPDGEIINMVPPKIAPNPRIANKKMRRFLIAFVFIVLWFVTLIVSLHSQSQGVLMFFLLSFGNSFLNISARSNIETGAVIAHGIAIRSNLSEKFG